jgi:hypothetical protein
MASGSKKTSLRPSGLGAIRKGASFATDLEESGGKKSAAEELSGADGSGRNRSPMQAAPSE